MKTLAALLIVAALVSGCGVSKDKHAAVQSALTDATNRIASLEAQNKTLAGTIDDLRMKLAAAEKRVTAPKAATP